MLDFFNFRKKPQPWTEAQLPQSSEVKNTIIFFIIFYYILWSCIERNVLGNLCPYCTFSAQLWRLGLNYWFFYIYLFIYSFPKQLIGYEDIYWGLYGGTVGRNFALQQEDPCHVTWCLEWTKVQTRIWEVHGERFYYNRKLKKLTRPFGNNWARVEINRTNRDSENNRGENEKFAVCKWRVIQIRGFTYA